MTAPKEEKTEEVKEEEVKEEKVKEEEVKEEEVKEEKVKEEKPAEPEEPAEPEGISMEQYYKELVPENIRNLKNVFVFDDNTTVEAAEEQIKEWVEAGKKVFLRATGIAAEEDHWKQEEMDQSKGWNAAIESTQKMVDAIWVTVDLHKNKDLMSLNKENLMEGWRSLPFVRAYNKYTGYGGDNYAAIGPDR